MSNNFNEFQRKVKNRQFAIDNSWRGDSEFQSSQKLPEEVDNSRQKMWNALNENLSEADACKFYDGYFPLHSHRKILGLVIVFFKKAVRKLLKVFLGWYLFPLYAQQSHFNGKILNAVSLERDVLLAIDQKIEELQSQLSELQKQTGIQAGTLDELRKNAAKTDESLRKIESLLTADNT